MKFFLPPDHPCMKSSGRPPSDCYWASTSGKDFTFFHTAFAIPAYREIKTAIRDEVKAVNGSAAPKFAIRRLGNERVLNARLWVCDVFDVFCSLVDSPLTLAVHAFKSYSPGIYEYEADRKFFTAWVNYDVTRRIQLHKTNETHSLASPRMDESFDSFISKARAAWTKALGTAPKPKDAGDDIMRFMLSTQKRESVTPQQASKELEDRYRKNCERLADDSERRINAAIEYANEQAAIRNRAARNR